MSRTVDRGIPVERLTSQSLTPEPQSLRTRSRTSGGCIANACSHTDRTTARGILAESPLPGLGSDP